jgi:preprotein translocase subunit SecF
MAMNRIVWTYLDTAIIVAISIMMLGMTGLAVHAKQKGGLQVAVLSSDWTCHPNHARGQLACLNTADGRHAIVATNLK